MAPMPESVEVCRCQPATATAVIAVTASARRTPTGIRVFGDFIGVIDGPFLVRTNLIQRQVRQ
ncbi:hypothetical protein BKG68_06505 [Mycobacteroides saopaulense]|uniref:Uncharacterized protein n=1 Tax=Mycobacteroides saopaulense TaxID=1578165 RepID=A0ABX3BUC6_9MYCO|nr:hypothetical protein MYCSP_11505 [Mycobacteroides saopaulense]OHT87675.1 hypothetical protein BKG68_06505 [Mycobacteroides saopaulense]OHU06019.1 hypothetical protein BKG73_20650 [Mycobacteroides saopaulense]